MTSCPNQTLTQITLPVVPSHAYTETSAVIGGVGRHLRWGVVFPNRKNKQPASLCVGGISDRQEFSQFVEGTLRPFGLCKLEFAREGGCYTTTVVVPDPARIGTVAAALHCSGYTATAAHEECKSYAKLAIERYDRSAHMWWNQSQHVAGPLRDVHRWIFDFVPSSWSSIPFTWQSLARNIKLDPLRDSQHLPLPLRDVFLTNHIEVLSEADDAEQIRQLKQLRGCPSVTSRLSVQQNRQLLMASYWCIIAPFDATTVHICQLIRYRYMMHGYTSREVGGYRQTAQHLGHGATIRKFRNKPQYTRANLSAKTLNQIYKTDGTLRGSGFKGTRGKYGHDDYPRYEPRKRMHRTLVQEQQMRQDIPNVFASYHAATTASD